MLLIIFMTSLDSWIDYFIIKTLDSSFMGSSRNSSFIIMDSPFTIIMNSSFIIIMDSSFTIMDSSFIRNYSS